MRLAPRRDRLLPVQVVSADVVVVVGGGSGFGGDSASEVERHGAPLHAAAMLQVLPQLRGVSLLDGRFMLPDGRLRHARRTDILWPRAWTPAGEGRRHTERQEVASRPAVEP